MNKEKVVVISEKKPSVISFSGAPIVEISGFIILNAIVKKTPPMTTEVRF